MSRELCMDCGQEGEGLDINWRCSACAHKAANRVKSYSEARRLAYQAIQPHDMGMSGFAEKVRVRPAWQAVIAQFEAGKDTEAQALASVLRENHENN